MRLFKTIIIALAVGLVAITWTSTEARTRVKVRKSPRPHFAAPVVVGAERTSEYLPLLKGNRIALLSNQTGVVGAKHDKHTLDLMLELGLNVTTIFSPEHGFRGKADAGEHVSSSVDEKTGIPIASLYEGKSGMPSKETMDRFDVIVTDIQIGQPLF